MAIEIYKGKYVTAEPASNYIDASTISAHCRLIKEGIESLEKNSKKLEEAKSYCTKDAFCIENKSFEGEVEMSSYNLKTAAKYMDEFQEKMLKALERAIDKKQIELNEIAKQKELEMFTQNEQMSNI